MSSNSSLKKGAFVAVADAAIANMAQPFQYRANNNAWQSREDYNTWQSRKDNTWWSSGKSSGGNAWQQTWQQDKSSWRAGQNWEKKSTQSHWDKKVAASGMVQSWRVDNRWSTR